MNIATFRSERIALALTIVLVLGGAAAHGQRPQGGGAGGTLSVDFTAVTADGKPVAELAPADVTVKIGGKVRTVTALTLKSSAAGASAGAAPAGITPPFSTNDAKPKAEGRSFMIVVDADSLPPGSEPALKTAIENLLKSVTASDRVGFAIAPKDTAQAGLGSSMEKVRAAVGALRGQRPASVSTADALCRTHDTLGLLKSLMEQFAGNESPISVIVIAGTMSMPDTNGQCGVTQEDYKAVSRAAAIGRANVYVVQGDSATMGRNDGLEMLTGVTGAGQVLRVVNDGFAPKVLADASSYWVATVSGDPGDRPGQAQQLDVKAVKAGVTVDARPDFVAPGASANAAAAAPKTGSVAPKDMIASAATYSELPLQATAVVLRGQGEKMNVLVMAAPTDTTAKITAMRVGYFDSTNKGGSLDAPQILTYPIATVIPLDPGQYRIRVAAQAGGKSGAVDVDVNASLTTAGTLKMSHLLLGALDEKGGLKPRLIFTPAEEKLQAFFELYGTPTAEVSLKVELAKTDAGPALKTLQPTGGGPTEEPDKFSVVTEIPIKDLEPGDYVVRITMQMKGQPEGKIMRTFRKVAK
jgi:hypothetical protein